MLKPKQLTDLRNQVVSLEARQAKAMHEQCKATFLKALQELRDAGFNIGPKAERIYSAMFQAGASAALDVADREGIKSPQAPVIWSVCAESGRPFHTV